MTTVEPAKHHNVFGTVRRCIQTDRPRPTKNAIEFSGTDEEVQPMNVLIDANVALAMILEREPWLGDTKGVWDVCFRSRQRLIIQPRMAQPIEASVRRCDDCVYRSARVCPKLTLRPAEARMGFRLGPVLSRLYERRGQLYQVYC
jgi:hypothetical protein